MLSACATIRLRFMSNRHIYNRQRRDNFCLCQSTKRIIAGLLSFLCGLSTVGCG